MPNLPKCGACDSSKEVLGVCIAENELNAPASFKTSAIGLDEYILADYKQGEGIRFKDFVLDGYSKQSLFKLKNRMIANGYIKPSPTRGLFIVC